MRDAAQVSDQFRLEIEFQQAQHLRVAVLLDDINMFVLLDEFMHFARKRISPQPQVVGLEAVFFAHLIAAFGNAPVGSPITDDSDLRVVPLRNFWSWNEGPRSFEFAVQALHIVLEVVGAFAVLSLFVMAAASCEVGGRRMRRTGKRAVSDSVAIDIFVASESTKAIEILFTQNLA